MVYKPQILTISLSQTFLWTSLCRVSEEKFASSLANLSLVSLIYRPPSIEHKRVEEKCFLPDSEDSLADLLADTLCNSIGVFLQEPLRLWWIEKGKQFQPREVAQGKGKRRQDLREHITFPAGASFSRLRNAFACAPTQWRLISTEHLIVAKPTKTDG